VETPDPNNHEGDKPEKPKRERKPRKPKGSSNPIKEESKDA